MTLTPNASYMSQEILKNQGFQMLLCPSGHEKLMENFPWQLLNCHKKYNSSTNHTVGLPWNVSSTELEGVKIGHLG
jgi:hypothetical protein